MRRLLAASAVLFTTWTYAAQGDGTSAYPTRPIRFIVPFAPGGGTDIVARMYAIDVGRRLKQNVVVENRPGGAGTVGIDMTANATPDGYTICIISGSNAVNAATNSKLPFDLAKDVQGISQVTSGFNVLITHPTFPAKTVKDLIAYAKANPGKLNYGTSGTGSLNHLGWVMLAHMTQISVVHVPYRGEAMATAELLGGQTQMQLSSLLNSNPHINAGRVRAVAMTAPKRSPVLPDVPTVSESGLPGYTLLQWYGVITAPKVPRPIVDKLSAEFATSARDPEVMKRLRNDGVEAVSSSPAEFTQHVRAEIARWGKLVRETGLVLQ
ncbi:MAG: Bug family tripartite tricarboxylate transporter substrate binding protein [Burkholderiales bacterium]